jgi:hypothetical protein
MHDVNFMRQVNFRLLRSLSTDLELDDLKSRCYALQHWCTIRTLPCNARNLIETRMVDVSAVLDLVTGRKINGMVIVEFDTDGKVQPPLHRRYSLQKASLAWRQLG